MRAGILILSVLFLSCHHNPQERNTITLNHPRAEVSSTLDQVNATMQRLMVWNQVFGYAVDSMGGVTFLDRNLEAMDSLAATKGLSPEECQHLVTWARFLADDHLNPCVRGLYDWFYAYRDQPGLEPDDQRWIALMLSSTSGPFLWDRRRVIDRDDRMVLVMDSRYKLR